MIFTAFVACCTLDGLASDVIANDIVSNSKEDVISWVESMDPGLRSIIHDTLETALLERQKVLTESVFIESHPKAIDLYRDICKENNLPVKL